jgi:hypothetical protein
VARDRQEEMKPWPTALAAIKVRRLPLIKRRHRRWLREQVLDLLEGQDDAALFD